MAKMPKELDKKCNYGPTQVGWASPQFPSVGPKQPEPPGGQYQSQIDTKPFGAIDPGIMRQIQQTMTPISVRALVGAFEGVGQTGGKAGNASRAAFARGVTDTSSNAVGRASDKFNTEFTAQAEKSRAEDINAQRENTFDRFRMDVMNAIFGADRMMAYQTDLADIKAYAKREIANASAKFWSSFLGGL